MKRLVEYVRVIEKKQVAPAIVDQKTDSVNTRSGYKNTSVYKFEDGVTVEYEYEYDDGSPYPGAKESWYTYSVVDANNQDFVGDTVQTFMGQRDRNNWLETD